MDFLIAGMIIAAVVAVWWLVTHRKPAPASSPSVVDLANTVANATTATWGALKRDLPTIVSAELAQAKADLAAALKRAQTAEQALANAQAAHEAALATVASRVAAAVVASPEIAAMAPPAPIEPVAQPLVQAPISEPPVATLAVQQ